jgi:hypothetical protein
VVRADGTDTRLLTDDVFKDRQPTWSPDGKTLGFFSTRSGRWESWAIQADGSGLRQLTNFDKDTDNVTWSPDGTRAIVASSSTHGVWRLDPSRLNTSQSAEPLPGPTAAHLFTVQGWSRSGALLAGAAYVGPLSAIPSIWDVSKGTLRKLDLPGSDPNDIWMSFLPDSRRVLVTSRDGLMLIDLADGHAHKLQTPVPGDRYRLSRDGRTLLIQHPIFDSDIGLMESKR